MWSSCTPKLSRGQVTNQWKATVAWWRRMQARFHILNSHRYWGIPPLHRKLLFTYFRHEGIIFLPRNFAGYFRCPPSRRGGVLVTKVGKQWKSFSNTLYQNNHKMIKLQWKNNVHIPFFTLLFDTKTYFLIKPRNFTLWVVLESSVGWWGRN